MKHISLTLIIAALVAAPLSAQETYQNADIATEDLNGTARYVGMGGAMDALGADISTIGTNPAGIGLFRHSSAAVSFGFVSQGDAPTFTGGDKTNMSFDQAGFVYSRRTGRRSYINLAFNYHKSRNFDYILAAAGALNGASQNKLSYLKEADGLINLYERDGYIQSDDYAFSQVDYLYYNTLLVAPDGRTAYHEADGYTLGRSSTGYIGEYDFNISGNLDDRVYLGLTFGISDVNYRAYGEYTEAIVGGAGTVTLADERRIDGTGFNVKAGIIVRPIEASPLRIGVSVATPTWYDLTTSNSADLHNSTPYGSYTGCPVAESYDFKLYTPWMFGLSLGTTVGSSLALGLGYEYADYGSLDSRINTGGGYDWYYGDYYETTSPDDVMNRHTARTLKGVSTLRLGLELKPTRNLALRAGYNYVSPMYADGGYKDMTLPSPGTFYGSTTDYVNWDATNRVTLGLGYTAGSFTFDAAYQYSCQNGDFSPFASYYSPGEGGQGEACASSPVSVDNKRHQLVVTLGYHF